MSLSATPDSTSANAWPTRPFQALPRPIRGSIGLRAFRNVPSGTSVRADCVMPHSATKRAAVQLIETDSISVIGPTRAVPSFNLGSESLNDEQASVIRHGCVPFVDHGDGDEPARPFGRESDTDPDRSKRGSQLTQPNR